MKKIYGSEKIKYEFHRDGVNYISLKPGAIGIIEKVDLNPNGDRITYMHNGRKNTLDLPIDRMHRISLGLGFGEAIPGELEKCTQETFEKMKTLGLPLDDLEEIRFLEQQLRSAIGDYRSP